MSVLMVYQGLAGRAIEANSVPLGAFLQSYDPEAHEGRGWAQWTVDREKAVVFADISDAMLTWLAVPEARPKRPDGKPNRPLTAFNVTFITV